MIVKCRQQRFGQFTQEDSHELLRYLLYELKKEEIDVSICTINISIA